MKILGEPSKIKELKLGRCCLNKIGTKMNSLLSHLAAQENPKGSIHFLSTPHFLAKKKLTTKILFAISQTQLEKWCLASFATKWQKDVRNREFPFKNSRPFAIWKNSKDSMLWCSFWTKTKTKARLKERCEIFLKIFSRKFWEEHI